MKICNKCILPITFPGIKFNEEGVCNYCLEFKGIEQLNEKKEEYRKRFESLIEQFRGRYRYDVLMCYSGGKDSTYTLAMLKQNYNLNVIAITFDNGFIPERTIRNIYNIVEYLGVDHILFKPRFDLLKKIFVTCSKKNIYPTKSLERASTICTSCMGIVKFRTLRFAIEERIPIIAFGWSPGQAPINSSIMKNNKQMVKMMQDVIYKPLYSIAGDEINPYFLEEKHFELDYEFPYNISPLAFFDYNESNILRKIKDMGWELPQDTDKNSTNCLLNSFANFVHIKEFGYHPYVLEIANLVRIGVMSREEGIKKIEDLGSDKVIDYVKRKLSIDVS